MRFIHQLVLLVSLTLLQSGPLLAVPADLGAAFPSSGTVELWPLPLPEQDVPVIAAAADLQFVLARISEQFQQDTGARVLLTFASSGNLTQQIERGAPFQLFLSADENSIFHLAESGLTFDEGMVYAIGRIVLFAPYSSPLAVDGVLRGLDAALDDGLISRFVIANPDHAPYGRAAVSVLNLREVHDELRPWLIYGENAAVAAQLVTSESVQGGIIPLSLALSDEVSRLGNFALIPSEWHGDEPLVQRMVLLASAGETARAFYAYLQQPAARAILRTYGFVLPTEPVSR